MYSLPPVAGGCAITGSHRGGHHWPDTYVYLRNYHIRLVQSHN